MTIKRPKAITYLTILLSLFLAVVSFEGIFIPSTYERETVSLADQGIGQDIFDLFFVVPLLLISLHFTLKKRRTAIYMLTGTVLYILYSFFIYSFGIHFNRLFLLYCFTLGLSFYLFIMLIIEFNKQKIKDWFEDRVPLKSTALFFIIIAVMFYLLWFSDIIPAIVNNSVSKSVSDYNLLVNPVHVMDIAFMLPGLIIISILLIKRHSFGYIFAPVFLVFIILLSFSLIAMAIMLNVKNVSEDLSLVGIFGILAAISFVYLIIFMKRIKNSTLIKT